MFWCPWRDSNSHYTRFELVPSAKLEYKDKKFREATSDVELEITLNRPLPKVTICYPTLVERLGIEPRHNSFHCRL